MFPVDTDNEGVVGGIGCTVFIFDTELQSWTIHKLKQFYGSIAPAYLQFAGGLLNLGTDLFVHSGYTTDLAIWYYDSEGSLADETYNDGIAGDIYYPYEMISAPIPFPKTAVYNATLVEPIIESDLYAETNWSLIADFGKQSSGNQTCDAITTSVAKPAANVGITNATYVQVKMAGTTVADKTVGLDLYSYNVWYDNGETGSR